ncbi:MAG: DUF1559 domain-containing protein, partial [Pirellulales bacterium]
MRTCSFALRSACAACALMVFGAAAATALAQKSAPAKKPPAARAPGKPSTSVGDTKNAPATAKKTLDLKFASSRAVAAAVLHPQRLLSSPHVQAMPVEILEATLQEQAGIDLKQVQEVVLFVGVNPAPSPAVIVRFSGPCRQAAIVEALTTGEGEKIDGRDTYRLKGRDPLFAVFPDERTLLAGSAADLADMLDQNDPAGPLVDHLRTVDASETLGAVVVVEPVRPLLKGLISQLPPLPPQYQQFTVLADVLAAIELHVSGESLTPSLVLEGVGKSETAKIDHLLDRAIEFAGAAVDHRAAQLAAEDPGPVSEATGKYLKRMRNAAIAALGRQQSGNRLTVAVKSDTSLTPSMAASGVLVALLLPAVQSARDAARLAQATNNLKQIGIAMHNHHDVFAAFPARARFENGKPLLSWRVAILPFIEQKALYDQFHLDEPWDSEHNRKLIEKMPPVYANPRLDARLVQAGRTNYLAPTGPGTLFEGEKGAGLGTIRDGTSNTVMVVEANADRAVAWTAPDDLEIDPDHPHDGLGEFQRGFIMALFADGHVSRLTSR